MVKTESTNTLRTGQPAPQFSLRGIDEKTYSLENFSESKILLVVFICNHCPYVKARIGDLVRLQSKFSTDDLTILGINSNDPNYENEGFQEAPPTGDIANCRLPICYCRLLLKPQLAIRKSSMTLLSFERSFSLLKKCADAFILVFSRKTQRKEIHLAT